MRFVVATIAGSDGSRIERGLVEHPGSVVILGVDDGHVILIRNRRWTVGKVLLELPAGTMTRGEDPTAAAAREFTEETGYRASSLQRLMAFYAAPGSSDERMVGYVATGLEHVGQALEADEEIEVVRVPTAQLTHLMRSGQVEDAKSLAMIGRYLLDSA